MGETTPNLVLERKDQENKTVQVGMLALAPMIDENYWAYRVKLSDTQAIVGFPKFGTIGIGFAVEEDRNTNFPYTVDAEETFEHIACNKGDDAIARETCIAAIEMIQAAVRADRGEHV